jgi:hypothetical protein
MGLEEVTYNPLFFRQVSVASVARMSEAKSGVSLSSHNPACRFAHAGYLLRGENASMKRMVVDKNLLEADELRAYLAESKDNFAVITDYAQLEMLKGDALVNILILKSSEILPQFPKQVLIVKPIDVISGLRAKKKGRKKRFTSGRATTAFRKWCKKRAPAKAGDKRLQQQIVDASKEAAGQLAAMLENAGTFAENIDEAAKRFSREELEISLRSIRATFVCKTRAQNKNASRERFRIFTSPRCAGRGRAKRG